MYQVSPPVVNINTRYNNYYHSFKIFSFLLIMSSTYFPFFLSSIKIVFLVHDVDDGCGVDDVHGFDGDDVHDDGDDDLNRDDDP